METILNQLKKVNKIIPPFLGQDISHGDMPGDKVEIGQDHIDKSIVVFHKLMKIIPEALKTCSSEKLVITVCGGSGVGKSEIASLLTYYFDQVGIGAYTLSGDNYPRRIPLFNDGERLRIFRQSGIKALVQGDVLTPENRRILQELQEEDDDANTLHLKIYPWYQMYLTGGLEGLSAYLGSRNEIDFDDLSRIVHAFKEGEESIWLKRMGRGQSDLWYEKVDFSQISVMIIEWTHGNSDHYQGVDIPVLLNSTPKETLEHRSRRNRDGKTDSPFTMRVLEIEQEMLVSQAEKAKIILSKQGDILSYEEYMGRMNRSSKEEARHD